MLKQPKILSRLNYIMSAYNPPTENVPIFDSSLFRQENGDTLTMNIADKRYLRFPIGQGQETIPSLVVQQDATINGDIILTDGTTNSTISQVAGDLVFNNLKGTLFKTANGSSATPTIQAIDTIANKKITLLPNVGAGSYNPASSAGNEVIMAIGGAIGTETLELTTWSSTNSSVKVAPTSVSIGAGGATSNPTTSVVCNGTSVVVAPSITYPDGKVQNSAFTGAGALTGSYTNTNMTIDANGKITALANGSSTIPSNLTLNNMTISATDKYTGGNAGIVNHFNTGSVFDFAGSGTNQISITIDSWTQTTINATNAVFEVNFNFWNGSNFGTTSCMLVLFPNRWVSTWQNSNTYNINNKINGNANFNYSDRTLSPAGRQYWTYNQSFSGIDGANAYLNGSLGYCVLKFLMPDSSYQYAGTIRCLNTKLVQGQNRCFEIHN